ncbi:tRNA-intron lyase [Malassezia vespertilionis]|uniref:tRNA-intron lyase n=1 Tax=Malassezia vespertilionis TaxID=2020962 RepID=UPI0024B229C7|nr:tRNA-intron lyase [Malassezia vespertilionis]WFD08391.1 tRNA-intron lyase [Malassezia vespertilionis]
MNTAAGLPGTHATVKGAGKKATQAKRHLYAKPLPVGRASNEWNPSAPRTWLEKFNEWSKWLYDGVSSPPMYRAWYDDTTESVWMYDSGDAQALWTQGFFGKGNLSRSEPTWAARQLAAASARSRGEQMTQRRREERKLLKIERARAAVKAGIQLPDGITALGGALDEDLDASETSGTLWRGDEDVPEIETGVARVKGLKYFSTDVHRRKEQDEAGAGETDLLAVPDDDPEKFDGIEHFQLTLIEAFFLAGMLGCLEVCDRNGRVMSLEALYHRCLHSTLLPTITAASPNPAPRLWARPDNPFFLSYIVYHHFRSLGWVVKNGTKFCVDYLLYKKGPVFSHAEFSVIVVPEYADVQDAVDSPFRPHHNGGEKSWVWFSMLNRVNTQVQKTMILAHVMVPSQKQISDADLSRPQTLVALLRQGYFAVKEVTIRRWVPARMKP